MTVITMQPLRWPDTVRKFTGIWCNWLHAARHGGSAEVRFDSSSPTKVDTSLIDAELAMPRKWKIIKYRGVWLLHYNFCGMNFAAPQDFPTWEAALKAARTVNIYKFLNRCADMYGRERLDKDFLNILVRERLCGAGDGWSLKP